MPSNIIRKVCMSIVIIIFVLNQYIYLSKNTAYEIYINGKFVALIKNKEELYMIKNEIENELEKRFGKIYLKDDIKFKKTLVNPKNLTNPNLLKNILLKNSVTNVSAVLMKSDGKKVAILANEDEMRKVLDLIKSLYKLKDADNSYILKNHITYIKEEVAVGQINTVSEAVSIATKEKSSLISFYKEEELNNVYNISLSRASSMINFFYTPSKGTVTSLFGMRWGRMHNGIDIGSPMGAPIYAAMDGKVSCKEWEDGYGNVIKIEHGSDIQTVYAHCSSIDVSVGEYVKRGEKIGEVGSTGSSTGPHVHFEVRIKGIPQNPLTYLK